MSMPGYAITLLKACGVNNEQLLQVLAPINGRLPQNEDELRQLQAYLRRMGHILEAFPNNVAQSLGQRHPQPQHTFFGGSSGSQSLDAAPQTPWSQSVGWADSSTGWDIGQGSGMAGWSGVGSQSLDTTSAYPATGPDSGTESDSSSDDWDTPLDNPYLQEPPERQEQSVYWQYAQAKRLWRRYSQKPIRKVRRFVKRKGGKGGKSSGTFMT